MLVGKALPHCGEDGVIHAVASGGPEARQLLHQSKERPEKPPALWAPARVVFEALAVGGEQALVHVLRHPAGGPPVIEPEAQSVAETGHAVLDPMGAGTIQRGEPNPFAGDEV